MENTENKLGEFVVKYLKDKITTRQIIKCDDFFEIIYYMGYDDEDNEVIKIIDYLDENNIDINFHDAKTAEFYKRFKVIEKNIKLSKMLKGSKTETQRLIEKIDSIKIEERPDWLSEYMDDDDTDTNLRVTSEKDKNLGKNIIDRLTNQIKEQIENEPGITIEELQREIDNEIVHQDNPIMGEMNGGELIDFLTNRIVPERFQNNNNNNN